MAIVKTPGLEEYAGRLRTQWMDRGCPICQSSSWTMNSSVWGLINLQEKSLAMNKVFPVLVATCETCGHLHLFSGIKAGLYSEEVPDGE